jgi:hypothetical protein
MGAVEHATGVLPPINDIVAGIAMFFAYVVRFGVITEGVGGWWGLRVTTDVILPVLGAVWLLVVPTAQVLKRLFLE